MNHLGAAHLPHLRSGAPFAPLEGGSTLERIRCATRALHDQIEQSVPVLRPGADELTYRGYLEKLLGFHRPLEPVLFASGGLYELGIRRAEREKAPWLARDLLALGLSLEELVALPRCRRLPPLPSLGSALGCCYVLEGATLGAQLIHRELSRRLPGTMAQASSYLRCYGEETGRRWKAFCFALEHHGQRREETQSEMADAACATFRSLQAWLLLDTGALAPGPHSHLPGEDALARGRRAGDLPSVAASAPGSAHV